MRKKLLSGIVMFCLFFSMSSFAWAGSVLGRPELSTFAEIFGLVDFLALMYFLHKVYHAIFHVIYIGGIVAMFKELLATWIIAAIIMQIPYNMYLSGSITGAYVVLTVILLLPFVFARKNKD